MGKGGRGRREEGEVKVSRRQKKIRSGTVCKEEPYSLASLTVACSGP